jgi:hypothetical protein
VMVILIGMLHFFYFFQHFYFCCLDKVEVSQSGV